MGVSYAGAVRPQPARHAGGRRQGHSRKALSRLELASIIRLIRWGQPFVNPQLAFRLLPAPTRHRPA